MRSARGGWKPDPPDSRDHRFDESLLRVAAAGPPPEDVDNRPLIKTLLTQLGKDCTYVSTLQQLWVALGCNAPEPSRSFGYANCRLLDGTFPQDDGTSFRTAYKATKRYGLVADAVYPYSGATLNQKPGRDVYRQARPITFEYGLVPQKERTLKQFLAEGHLINFGFDTFPSLDWKSVEKTGMILMPQPGEVSDDGHGMLMLGFRNAIRHFLCANWWGAAWGDAGFAWMPFDYVLDPALATCFWTARNVMYA